MLIWSSETKLVRTGPVSKDYFTSSKMTFLGSSEVFHGWVSSWQVTVGEGPRQGQCGGGPSDTPSPLHSGLSRCVSIMPHLRLSVIFLYCLNSSFSSWPYSPSPPSTWSLILFLILHSPGLPRLGLHPVPEPGVHIPGGKPKRQTVTMSGGTHSPTLPEVRADAKRR